MTQKISISGYYLGYVYFFNNKRRIITMGKETETEILYRILGVKTTTYQVLKFY